MLAGWWIGESSDILDDTLIYCIIGDNGASGEGTLHGTYNEMINFNGAAALETTQFLIEHWTSWADRNRTTTMRSDGHTRLIRRISGPSRLRRIVAERATARSCTGRRESRRRASCGRSSIT